MIEADDYFAGAGGWDIGAGSLGIHARGIEKMDAARATRDAAGLTTVHDDVWTYQPDGHAVGQITSAPCPTFSQAGGGSGRTHMHVVLDAIRTGAWRSIDQLRALGERVGDERTALVLTPLHYAMAYDYEWLAWEQVPTVLPVWQACARELAADGWYVWVGYVHAEQYGVAQTRKRALLLASRRRRMHMPTPTHSKFYSNNPARLDPGVRKWVSMAEALQLGEHVVGMTTEVGKSRQIDGAKPLRTVDQPAWTVHGGAANGEGGGIRHRWMLGAGPGGAGAPRADDHPAPTITGKGTAQWVYDTDDWYGPGSPAQRSEVPGDDALLCPTNLRPNAALRSQDQPAPTMAFGHEEPRWVTPEELAEYRARVAAEVEPRVNNQSGTLFDLAWPADRPAPTIAGRDLVGMPGANANRFNGSTKSRNDGVRITVAEAGMLQSFAPDYTWRGNKGQQYLQAGNAVPPLLARAGLAVAAGLEEPYRDTDLLDMLDT